MDIEAILIELAQTGSVVLSTSRGGWKAAHAPGGMSWDVEPGVGIRYATGRSPTGALRALLTLPATGGNADEDMPGRNFGPR